MNLFAHFQQIVRAEIEALAQSGRLPAGLDINRVAVEPPREAAHGDLATNAAMVLAKAAKKKPRDIAEPLLARLKANPDVVDGAVAGPGFINLKIADAFWRDRLRECLKAGIAYGDSPMGQGAKVNVEYVSANPTGPLTVGHARGAVVGDALANLLLKAGYAVTKEYYINDAGAQVDKLGQSTFLRYKEALGFSPTLPRGFHGMARSLLARNQLTEAMNQAQAALRLSPRDLEVHHTVGAIYERMHKYEEAAAAYGNYVNLLPNKDTSEKASWSRAEIRFLRSFAQRVPFEADPGTDDHQRFMGDQRACGAHLTPGEASQDDARDQRRDGKREIRQQERGPEARPAEQHVRTEVPDPAGDIGRRRPADAGVDPTDVA